ncbi:GRB10-interacting GYF protein 2 [Cichlidogyrus casuarinus]|uniref:GRB10-interacting GYF protein 2 n=1 Tax=Cichlidogyrus casuarinus TaxID=1844966 RepID=A0ABD2PKB0_9PLAT
MIFTVFYFAAESQGQEQNKRLQAKQQKVPQKGPDSTQESLSKRQPVSNNEKRGDSYVTPLQRKQATIKELRKQIEETQILNEKRQKELQDLHQTRLNRLADLEFKKEKRLAEIKDRIEKLKQEQIDIDNKQEIERKRLVALEETLENLKVGYLCVIASFQLQSEQRQKVNQELFLKIYKKGQESADYERKMKLESNEQVSTEKIKKVNNMLSQLDKTQTALNYWQALKHDYKQTPVIAVNYRPTRQNELSLEDGDELTEEELEAFLRRVYSSR